MPSVTWDEAALRQAGGRVLPSGDGIAFAGWTVQARSAPITKDADMAAFGARAGGATHLPEQLFGDSHVTLRHEASGARLAFDALGALRAWHAADLPPLQVEHAASWQRARARDMQANNVAALQYDWTFTTSYQGDYEQPGGGELAWQPSDRPLDKAPLLQREPILFFADLPLYESELDDSGASQLSVKIRVMPSCWFLLLRFWLRVDGSLVRLRETRLLCHTKAEAGLLWREALHSEGSFRELAAAGAPASAAAYADADTTARVLQAVAPVGCKLYRTEVCRLPGRPAQ